VVTGSAATSRIAVTAPAPEPLLSLTIIPSAITVGNLQDTGQFLAIGTFSTAPYVRDLTNFADGELDLGRAQCVPGGHELRWQCGGDGRDGDRVWVWKREHHCGERPAATGRSRLRRRRSTARWLCPIPTATRRLRGRAYRRRRRMPCWQTLDHLQRRPKYHQLGGDSGFGYSAPRMLFIAAALVGLAQAGSVCTATYPLTQNATTQVILTGPAVVLEAQGGNFGGWSYNCTPSTSTGTPLTSAPYYTAAGPNYLRRSRFRPLNGVPKFQHNDWGHLQLAEESKTRQARPSFGAAFVCGCVRDEVVLRRSS
jgi:hypothetical protein